MFTDAVSKEKEVSLIYHSYLALKITFCFLVECINATELSSRVHTTPMVPNPIYEGGVIYEEIPDVGSKQKNPLTENVEAHVPTENQRVHGDITSSEKCAYAVSVIVSCWGLTQEACVFIADLHDIVYTVAICCCHETLFAYSTLQRKSLPLAI